MHFIWCLTGLTAFVLTQAYGLEVYFSPSPDCEKRIIGAIDDSKTEVIAAVYSINNVAISEALTRAKKCGVAIRLLTDYTQATQKSSQALALQKAGLDVRLHSKFKIEHNKFGVYDSKLVSTGSFNWTRPASESNSENCVFIDDVATITKFRDRFEFLWKENSSEASLAKIEKLNSKMKNGQ